MTIKFDTTELPALFDFAAIESLTNPSIGSYAYQYQRSDGTAIRLSFNQYEDFASLSVATESITISSLHLPGCIAIRVLDTARRQFELLFETTPKLRCFVDLTGNTILSISEYSS